MQATLRMETPHRRPPSPLYERAVMIGPFPVPPDFVAPEEATLPHPQNPRILDVYALKRVEGDSERVLATYVYKTARRRPL